jgi:hypothetical protein
MDSTELERLLGQLESAENGLFHLIEADPLVIREPTVQQALAHLKGALDSLRAARQKIAEKARLGFPRGQ